jgi:chromosomal replication initiation ATPase DnaA
MGTRNSNSWLQASAKELTVPEQGDVPWVLIISMLRYKHVVAARRAVCIRLKELGWSYPAIGIAIGGRDHSSIQSMVKGTRKKKPV